MKITQAIVRELLDYNPRNGKLVWRQRDRQWFDSEGEWRRWNTRYAGKLAFTCCNNEGYLKGEIFDHSYKAHRVIFLWMTGHWPNSQVDHKNQNKWDNRWQNLQEATNQVNSRNRPLRRDNTSGHVGISIRKNGKFAAVISFGGRRHHLGTFVSFEDAAAARQIAQSNHGYAEKHGCIREIR